MNEIINYICNIILLFFVFSVCGWFIEVALKYRQFHRFINRGFLIGPYLPIYGSGAALITLLLDLLSNYDDSYGTTFVVSFFACGILEYLVSYCLEKRFHARWWDYSQKPMNLNGRVWIGNLILFGIGGTLIFKVIDPFFLGFMEQMPSLAKEICSALVILVMGSDYIVSHFVMKLLKTGVENSKADDTESLNKEMMLLFTNRSILHKRMIEAYPDVVYRTDRIYDRLNEIKRESELLSQELQEKINENTEQFIYNNEPVTLIKNKMIEKQAELIRTLETPGADPEKIRELHLEIDEIRNRLSNREDFVTRISETVLNTRDQFVSFKESVRQ